MAIVTKKVATKKVATKKVAAKSVKLPATIKVSGLLNAAGLKLALVALFDDRIAEIAKRLVISEKSLEAQGKVALAITAQGCFFCGSTATTKGLSYPNREDVLCPCMKSLRSGYRELRPGWKEVVAKATASIPKKIEGSEPTPPMKAAWLKASSELLRAFSGARTVLYSDQCCVSTCRANFSIDSGLVAGAVRSHGPYNRSTKCEKCRTAARAEREAALLLAKGARQPTEAEVAEATTATAEASHGAKPKRAKKVREFARVVTPDIASQNSLEVTLGEMLRSKKAQEA